MKSKCPESKAKCPKCEEQTLLHDCDEFGEFCFCLDPECNYEEAL